MAITKLMEGLPNQSMSQEVFDAATGKYMADLPAWGGEANALAADVNAKQIAATDSAAAALGARDIALGYKDSSEAASDAAQGYRDQSVAARDLAQNYAAALTATSTTSLVIGVGTKVFATQAGKQFNANQTLKAVNPGNAAQWMVGTAAYSGTTLTLTVTDVNPATSGNTVANWVIGPSGEKGAAGATGGVTGGNLSGALNELRAPDVTTSATPDIWSGAGNLVRLVGDGTVTNFTTAPQNGASRTVLAVGNITFTNGANLVVYGGTLSVVSGDLLEVVAENTTRSRLVIKRENGTPAIGAKMYMVLLTSGSTWTVEATSFEVEVQAGGQGGYNLTSGSKKGGDAGWCGVKRFQGAVLGSTALLSFGAASAPGTATVAPAAGGTTSFTLSGFTTLSATFTGVTGADVTYAPRPGAETINAGATIYGQGGDSRNGFGAPMSGSGSQSGVGYGAGGGGGGGTATGGCIIIRYFK